VGCVYDSIKSYWYVDGNYVYGSFAITSDNWAGGVKFNYPPLNIRVYNPFPSAYMGAEETAEEAFLYVCHGAGATLPKRDTIDKRVINDVINNTGSVPLTLADIPGEAYPALNSLPPPTDTDHDGMPDEWEKVNNLDTNNAADRNTVGSDGYTMLEHYLNSIEFTHKVEGIELSMTGDSLIEITWADIFLGEDGYIIERAIPGQAFLFLDSVDANTGLYIDSSSNATNEYAYRIKAFNASNESPYSAEVLYTTIYYNVSTSVSGQGSVSPASGSFLKETIITLTAIPEQGWEFTHWSGEYSGTINPVSLTVNSDKTITANFSEISSSDDAHSSAKYRFYPNPVKDELEIELFNRYPQEVVIRLFDNTGRLIMAKYGQGSKFVLDMGNLYPGIYLIIVSGTNQETIIRRISKQ